MSDSVGAILSCFVLFEWRVLSWECWRGEVWVDAMALVERWMMVSVYGGVATLSCTYASTTHHTSQSRSRFKHVCAYSRHLTSESWMVFRSHSDVAVVYLMERFADCCRGDGGTWPLTAGGASQSQAAPSMDAVRVLTPCPAENRVVACAEL